MFKLSKKSVVGGAIVGLLLGGTLTAAAYFTTTGAGTGNGSVGSDTALVVHQASATYSNATTVPAFAGVLLPGTSVDVTFTVDNPSSGHEYLNDIHLASVTSDKTDCDSATHSDWFTMDDLSVDQDYAPGNGQAVAGHATIDFQNKSVSQDVCKGATLTFHYTSN